MGRLKEFLVLQLVSISVGCLVVAALLTIAGERVF